MTLPSKCTFIEIGLQPKNGDFVVVINIVVGTSFISLTDVELAHLFITLREKEEFSHVNVGEAYDTEIISKFDGSFTVDNYGGAYEIVYFNEGNGLYSSVGFISSGDIVELLRKERFINDQKLRIEYSIDEYSSELWVLLKDARNSFAHNPFLEGFLYSKAVSSYLAAEMVQNHLKFFEVELSRFIKKEYLVTDVESD